MAWGRLAAGLKEGWDEKSINKYPAIRIDETLITPVRVFAPVA
jgi:hypothetical protein